MSGVRETLTSRTPSPERPTMTEKKLFEVTPDDYQHRVSFRRPASAVSTRPKISGRLTSVRGARNHLGQMRYVVMVEYPSRYGISNYDTFDNLPGYYPLTVGAIWRDKRNPLDMPDDEQPRLIAHLHGGPLDEHKTALMPDRWNGEGIVRVDEDGQLNVYEPKRIPPGLRRAPTRHEQSWGYIGMIYDGTIHMRFLPKATEQVRESEAGKRDVLQRELRADRLDTGR
jgi:hypothetical protein